MSDGNTDSFSRNDDFLSCCVPVVLLTDTASGMCSPKSLSHLKKKKEQSIFACWHLRSECLLTGRALQKITSVRWFTQSCHTIKQVLTATYVIFMMRCCESSWWEITHAWWMRSLWNSHQMLKKFWRSLDNKGATYLQHKQQVLLNLSAIPIFSWIIIHGCSYSNC